MSEIRIPKNQQQLPTWMRFDPVLWIIVGIFVIYELVAHFKFHNEAGMQTLSNRIVAFVLAVGWPARILVAVGCAVLAIHLEGVF